MTVTFCRRGLVDRRRLETFDHRVSSIKPELAIVHTARLSSSEVCTFGAWLSDEEHERSHLFRHESDRVAYVVAHGLLRMELRRRFPQLLFPMAISTGRQHKPHLAERAHDVDFNISHTRGLAACLTSRGAKVGVDCEALSREFPAGLPEACLSPAENSWLEKQNESYPISFLRLWTLKEAATKAVGLGLSAEFRSFTTIPARMVDPGPHLGTAADWWLWQEKIDSRFLVAVAIAF